MQELSGKVALVTGGGQGLGEAICRSLGEAGATVVVADIREEQAQKVASSLVSGEGKAMPVRLDVSDERQAKEAVQRTVRDCGRLDILVNNAGIIRDNMFFKMTAEDWESVMNVHLKGAFLCSQAAQKHMVEQKYGRIVNLSSTSALGNRGQANYATAKAGLQGFTKTLAIELGRYGITVNAVAPGFVETEMTRATAERMGISFEEFIEGAAKQIPVQRIGQPEDIAAALLFFASEEAGFVSGQVLYVAGGPRG